MTDRDYNPSSTHPPLPPTSEDEQFSRLRLLRSRRVGITTYKRLLTEHGTAQNALAALPEVAVSAGAACHDGTTAPGKDADVLILDGDPLHYATFVETVFVNGKVVYRR